MKFAEEFRVVLVVHNLGFPNPHPIFNLLVGTAAANKQMEKAEWEDSEDDLKDLELKKGKSK